MRKRADEIKDYYINDDGNLVFTRDYHLKRGTCCGNRCLNCPFDYVNVPNTTCGS
ncbi:MAG: DUF5522 domain-containing protein [Bacteroidetes bacterium]|nr:DUF5522 domain-containing protein [Bacteroidota bacterium]